MANRIQIRNGATEPTTSNLLPYELGWDRTNSLLYINNNGTIENIVGKYIRVTPITPTAGTNYYLTFTGGIAQNTNYYLLENSLVKVWIGANGNSAYLVMGDSTHLGGITLYNNSHYINLVPGSLTNNRNITFPDAAGTVALTTDLSAYLPLTGGTLTGALLVNYTTADIGTIAGITFQRPVTGTSNAGAYITAKNNTISASIGVGSGGTNHGLYSSGYYDGTTYTTDGKWIIYRNSTGQMVVPETLCLTKTQDASGTVSNLPALVVGGAVTAQHIEIDGNEILSKSNGTTPGTLYLQDSTGIVSVSGSGGLVITATTSSTSTTTGALRVKGGIGCAGVINALASPCSWLSGQSGTDASYNVGDATDSTSYWPWLRQTNTSSKKWFSFGTLGNSFYMIGSATTRTTNGYDHGLYFDVSNGKLVVESCAVIRDSGTTARKIFLATSATKPSAAVAGDIVLVKV